MLVGPVGNTLIEIIFTSFTLIGTVGIFAYILNNISNIIEEMNKKKKEYKKDLEATVRYLEI